MSAGSTKTNDMKAQTQTFLKKLVVLIMVGMFGFLSPARADSAREFMLSCSYGVLAGTLVGAATLAFSDRPGDNLNRVARGASIGLYAGILLGFYVVYGVPGDGGSDEEVSAALLQEPPRLQVMPLLTERGLDGAVANLQVMRF